MSKQLRSHQLLKEHLAYEALDAPIARVWRMKGSRKLFAAVRQRP